MIAIAVTTADRPVPTLARSLASLRAAGFDQPVTVHADRAVPEALAPGVAVVENDPPLGGLKNWCHALEQTFVQTDAAWLLLLEDDVTWCPDAAAALEHDLDTVNPETAGYLSLYLHGTVAREMEARKGRPLPSGIHASRLGWRSCGSQAYAIPRRSAARLLANVEFRDYRANWSRNRNRDNVVSECFEKMGLDRLFRVPSLVNHDLGAGNSSLREKPARNTRYYTGRP